MKTASIQKILEIKPHTNADSLELATVMGWQVVVKKGEFKPGDFVVYVGVDSVLPEKPEFEFLRNKNFRIRICKLRGEKSNGICFPLSILLAGTEIVEDLEVSDLIGAKHYEKPPGGFLCGEAQGSFPTNLVSKTDEERLKNYKLVFDELKAVEVYIALKEDGSSGTFILDNSEFQVCSRNMSLKPSEGSLFWQVARQYNIEEKLRLIGKNLAIQGELCGGKVQGNKMGISGLKLFVFNIYDITERRYYNYAELKEFCIIHNLDMVPVLKVGLIEQNSIDELQNWVNTLKYDNGALAEGIVIRPTVERYSLSLKGRLSIKVISEEFELKYKD